MRQLGVFKNILLFKDQLIKSTKNNNLFTLWIDDNRELPEIQQLSLKSMVLTGHNVTLYSYGELNSIPNGINIVDADEILEKSKIFKYKKGFNKGSYSGFANWFRIKRLYEMGGIWVDCDILSIQNINHFDLSKNIISTQINRDGNISPNNALLKFKKKDKLLKSMLDYIEDVKEDIVHGQTGPALLKSMIDGQYKEYSKYLTNINLVSPINFLDYMDYLNPTAEIVNRLEFNEIWGFHIWNAMIKNSGNQHEKTNHGFYHDLKNAITKSSTEEEYEEKIKGIMEKKS